MHPDPHFPDDFAKNRIVKEAFDGGSANPMNIYEELKHNAGGRLSQEEKTQFVDRIIKNGLDDVKGKLHPRFVELATDHNDLFRGKEGFTAMRFEVVSKKRLRRSGDDSFDFWDDSVPSQKWDAWMERFDSIPEGSIMGGGHWWDSLERHFKVPEKGNPIIDLAGLNQRQQALVIKAAEELKKQYPGKDFWIITD